MPVNREEHWVPADDGVQLHAWVYRPDGRPAAGPAPAITMAHGYGGLKHKGLPPFAERFAEAGFVVIVHDHRGFGFSTGWPRRDVDPWRQVRDWRRVITYLQDLPGVDPDRIGVWGTSFAGGHALVLGGSDRRIGAVVAQVPAISVFEHGLRELSPEKRLAAQLRLDEDDRAQMRGQEPARQLLVSTDPDVPATSHDPDWVEFEASWDPLPGMETDPTITLRSTTKARMYDPGIWADRIGPTPLLMVVGDEDVVTPTGLALAAFDRAHDPKKLVTFPGGHFSAYTKHFETTSTAAADWFVEHLSSTAGN